MAPVREISTDFPPYLSTTGTSQYPADVLLLAAELRTELAPGFQLLQPLGSGAMAHVFLARDPLLKRLVAVKVLSPELAHDDIARARFIREAEASAAVSHPNVVAVHLVGELKNSKTPYFVMQFVEGRSLMEEIKTEGTFSDARAKRLIGEVASALEIAHVRGLVHRDIKPANIMIENDSERPIVVDFGISAILQRGKNPDEARLTQKGTYLGTPLYMSPEQASNGDITDRSDIYSLGAVAFELLVGRPPFEGNSVTVMAAHIKDEPPSVHALRPDLDPHLAELVDRCLSKDATRRPSAAEITSSLLPESRTVIEWPPPGLERLREQSRRVVNLGAVMCGLVLAFFVAISTQPTLGSAQWRGGEQSTLWANLNKPGIALTPVGGSEQRWQVATSGSPDMTPAWAFVISVLVASIIVLAAIVAGRAWRAARTVAGATGLGYPLRTCFDAAFDEDGDLGEVLNGIGRYALVSEAQRALLTTWRRRRGYVAAAALLATGLSPFLWMAGLTLHRGAGALVEPGDLVVLFAPAVIAVALTALIDLRIRTILGFLPTRRPSARRAARREVVRSWLRSMGLRTRRSKQARIWSLVAGGVGAFVIVVLGYVSLIIFAVAFISTAGIASSRREAEAWLAAFSREGTAPLAFRQLDSLLGASAVHAVQDVDSLAARTLLARSLLVDSTRVDSTPFAADFATARSVSVNYAEAAPGELSPNVFLFIREGGRLTPDMIAELRSYGQSPWLPWWRRFAHSAPLPTLWMWKSGLPTIRYPWERTTPRFAAFRELAQRNAAAGYFALVAGDPAEAELRARENVAAGIHLLRGSTNGEELTGLAVVNVGRAQLEVVGRRTQNTGLLAESERIKAALARWRSERLSLRAWQTLLADPSDPAGLENVAAEHGPAPVLSASLVSAAVFGYCRNAREMLFGIDPQRRQLVTRIVQISRVDRMDELGRLGDRWMDDMQRGIGKPYLFPPVRPLGWIGLGRLRDRISYCTWSATNLF